MRCCKTQWFSAGFDTLLGAAAKAMHAPSISRRPPGDFVSRPKLICQVLAVLAWPPADLCNARSHAIDDYGVYDKAQSRVCGRYDPGFLFRSGRFD